MPKVGDRVVVQGPKVGGARREGTLLQLVGATLIKVRWTDGSETLFAPGAGGVEYLPGRAKPGKASNGKKAPKAAGKKTAKKPGGTKAATAPKKGGKKKR